MKDRTGYSIFKFQGLLAIVFSLFAIASVKPVSAEELKAEPSDVIAFDASKDVSQLNDGTMTDDRGSGGVNTNVNVSSNQTLSSSSSGNSVNVNGNLSNGAITAGSNFGGSGVGSYVLNTGNNATINSGVSLSVLMMPQATPALN